MNNITRYEEQKSDFIKTEYDPKFCQLYIEYAEQNINPDGFWGKYKIDESLKKLWIDKYPDFKKTVALIPHITAHILNESVASILHIADKLQDFKTRSQIVMKMYDTYYKSEKDTGMLKDKGQNIREAKKTDIGNISDDDFENMQNYVDNDK